MSKRNNLISLFLSILLTACSGPEVRSTVQTNDHHLSCMELEDEIQRMESYRADSDSTLHMIGGAVRGTMNVSGILPLAIAANIVEDTPDASESRQEHLMSLYVSRGCTRDGNTQMVATQPVYIIAQPASAAYAPATPVSAYRQTVTEEPPRYSAEHIHSTSYLFE